MQPHWFSTPKHVLRSLAASVGLAVLLAAATAQTVKQPNASADDVSQSGARTSGVKKELMRAETGFFEAWKTKDMAYFRDHIPADGIFWGEYGIGSRNQQLAAQEGSAKVCTVAGYRLSNFGVLKLARGAYMLTYRAEQHASCNGEQVPVHMNGSSVYVRRGGRWQAIYRAEVPAKDPS